MEISDLAVRERAAEIAQDSDRAHETRAGLYSAGVTNRPY